jgi:hypothetical protein
MALVAVWLLMIWAVTASIAFRLSGEWGFWAATVAAGLCLASAEAALLILALLQGPNLALYGVLIGMLVRMGVPLIAGGVIYLVNQPLASAGLLYYVLIFYLATLVVETVLILSQIQNQSRSIGKS